MNLVQGSFRDRSGYVYCIDERIIRSVNASYLKDWQAAVSSGLLEECLAKKWLPGFHEVSPPEENAALGLEVERIPFISYPYEWCFSQLKDAALLTLDLHVAALEKGLVLKDASAYNVQFVGSSPRFIDLLSFERWKEGVPWQAYRQFCMHFLAPLALSRYLGLWAGTLTQMRTDGIPLARAAALLPWRARLRPGLALHLFAHAAMEKRHADARNAAGKLKDVCMRREQLINLALSLRSLIEKMKPPKAATQWGGYYGDTNYTEAALAFKREKVAAIAAAAGKPAGIAVDLGANTGMFSALLAPHFRYVLAPDGDALAVEQHYAALRNKGNSSILPLVLDLSNPSPALGWANAERASFTGRCKASMVAALALVHHLALTEGIPFREQARFFADMLDDGGVLLLEFVPPDDSQVQRMTLARQDDLGWYRLPALLNDFAADFVLENNIPIAESQRSLFVWRKR